MRKKRPGSTTPWRTPGDALFDRARDLIQQGSLADALPVLDQAARIHHTTGDVVKEAACLQLAATGARLLGDLTGAAERADAAARIAPAGTRESIAAAVEQAQIAAAGTDYRSASEGFAGAISEAERIGWRGQSLAALVRQRARVLALDGQMDPALAELARVTSLVAGQDDRAFLWAQIEEATALEAAGQRHAAQVAADSALRTAGALDDHVGRAQLALLGVARAVQGQDPVAAMEAAELARVEALSGRAPLSYLAGSLALAELADHQGDRLRAYATLVTALVTLGDLLGRAQGRALVEPELLEIHKRWGADEFAAVKAVYEDQRRRALARQPDGPGDERGDTK